MSRKCKVHSRFSKSTGRCLDCARIKSKRHRDKLRALGLARIQLTWVLEAKADSPWFQWITAPRISDANNSPS